MSRTKVAKKTGRKTGRQVASGPGKVRSRPKRLKQPAPRKAPVKKAPAEPIPAPPPVALPPMAPAVAPPAAVEHAERPQPLDDEALAPPVQDPDPASET